MVEATLSALDGERLRYRSDTWELTGEITIRRNGEVIEAEATTPERVRGRTALLRFELESKPQSINPGNIGKLDVELQPQDGTPVLLVRRNNGTDRYRLDAMTYA